MKKLLLITMALIGLLAACQPDNDNSGPKTVIVFDNTQGICAATVYDDPRRRDEDKIAEVPAGAISREIEWSPGASVPFFLKYHVSLEGIDDFSVDYVPDIGKDQTWVRIDPDIKNNIIIPSLTETVSSPYMLLSNNCYILIQSNYSFPFQLLRGDSPIRPDNQSTPLINSGERALYTITPGPASPYRLSVGADYATFPGSLVSFEAGYVYSFIFSGGTLSLVSEVEIKLENAAGFIFTPKFVEMVWVPRGSFQMGDTDGEGFERELPVHNVTLTGFYMSKTEVTQGQWYTVMGIDFNADFGRGNNYPMYYVSWYDALVFCNKLSMAEELTPAYRINNSTDPAMWGSVPTSNYDSTWDAVTIDSGSNGYRLPTEAQWEYAAKGGNGSPGNYLYSGSENVDDVAWYSGNNSPHGTKPVGSKQPNGLDLYDMSGNVYEWCWDWYGSYSSTAQTDPTGASSGTDRVVRGGYWDHVDRGVRPASRGTGKPFTKSELVGFRLVRAPSK
ncbi:MAG: formylglycine-generating enzyme family protein [Treponema sp.]|jgi:formylglycine-generating enzyme required for sulfatase activity|nr:formylglycine-generating enzyme family protein [Treponema sp.]